MVKCKRVDHVRRRKHITQGEEHRSLYLSYLEYCNKHDLDRMASFYTSTIKVNEVPMNPAAVAAQFAPLFSAFPDWHWEIRNLVVDGDYIAVHFTVTGTHRGVFQGIEATGRRVTISDSLLSPRRRQVHRGLGPHRYGRGDEADRAGRGAPLTQGHPKRSLAVAVTSPGYAAATYSTCAVDSPDRRSLQRHTSRAPPDRRPQVGYSSDDA